MYGIFTYIWVIFGVNVGIYSIHGAYGIIFPIKIAIYGYPLFSSEPKFKEYLMLPEQLSVVDG